KKTIEESVIKCIKFLIAKNYRETTEEKRKLLLEYLGEINFIKILLKQCVIFKYISYGNYDDISNLMGELLAMASSEYKNLEGKNENLQ
ncbi:MAG: hypothetical protein Q8N88_03450, partial [Nanoarchaeota archaeon]|nr:hypothetical protein [Nanoarchaeota archaeon]